MADANQPQVYVWGQHPEDVDLSGMEPQILNIPDDEPPYVPPIALPLGTYVWGMNIFSSTR